jgi:hypothetical protein
MDSIFLGRHVYCFNPDDNGGESLILSTEFMSNGDEEEGYYLYQELSLESYSNGATLHLSNSMLTPKKLRDLANKMESEASRIGYYFDE